MSQPLVRAVEISRFFPAGDETVHALDGVSMEAFPGEFAAIVGRSGSGKTTLLNIIGGLDRPDSGQVFVGDLEISALHENELTAFRRTQIGFVFQSFGLLPLLSAYENIELALRIAGAGPRRRAERTNELLELVGLTRRARHRPYELSGGEQQRVAVARALANQPPLLVADEPTGELDSHTSAEIFALLQRVAREQGTCIVASTHDLGIRDAADRVTTLEDGRLAPLQGQPPVPAPSPPRAAAQEESRPPVAGVIAAPQAPPPATAEPRVPPENDPAQWARPQS